jgi:hypothetical protein
MTPKSTTELSLVEAIPLPALDPKPKQARAAIKRCCAAWQRAYDAYLGGKPGDNTDKIIAAHRAGPAYCNAMPPLAGYESIRDFIACAAHGILIEAIPQNRANQLLYAAQVALSSLHYEPKPQKSAAFLRFLNDYHYSCRSSNPEGAGGFNPRKECEFARPSGPGLCCFSGD